VDEGFITELCVKFTPTGVTVTGKPDKRVADVESSGLTAGVDAPLGVILTAADKGNLIPKRSGDRKKQAGASAAAPLPKNSLCKRDFEGSDQELLARARAVAQAASGPTLVGRVRSGGAFSGEVTTSFGNWWAQASPQQRAVALVIPSRKKELTAEDIQKLSTMECPFRGTASFEVVESEAEDEPETVRPSPRENIRPPQ
jgi:hypothetical protein